MLSTYIHTHTTTGVASSIPQGMDDQQVYFDPDMGNFYVLRDRNAPAPVERVWTSRVYTTNLRKGKKTVMVDMVDGKVVEVTVMMTRTK